MSSTGDQIAVTLRGRQGAFSLDVEFAAPMRGVTAIFGPSGCGKTTILRCIAGLTPMTGRIQIGTDLWQDTEQGIFIAPHRRHLGYVFQEPSLFPHLSVRDNLLYGARRASAAGRAIADFDSMVDLLAIRPLLTRSTRALSGGERQRIAVGRALLSGPSMLLMDEPLSALDRASKDDILPLFEVLHERLAIPILYVSHDMSEIERLADTLILIRDGRVEASGPLTAMQTDPTASLLSAPQATVVLEGRVAQIDTDFSLTELHVDGGVLIVPGQHGAAGDRRRLRIAASDVSVATAAPVATSIVNCLRARIIAIHGAPRAPHASILLALGEDGNGATIAARITRKSVATLGLTPGLAVYAQIKGVALIASRTAG